MSVKFDISDVPEPIWLPAGTRPGTEPIPIDEEDMLETACLLPERVGLGTLPPPFGSVGDTMVELLDDVDPDDGDPDDGASLVPRRTSTAGGTLLPWLESIADVELIVLFRDREGAGNK